MKFALFALASLSSSAYATDYNLRSAIKKFVSSAASETYDARIIVDGLAADLSAEEVELVTKETLAAYNEAYGFDKAGQKLGSVNARGFSTIPADSMWWAASKTTEEAAFISTQVDVMFYKDGFGSSLEFGDMHKEFELDLCDRLRKSSYPNLANAHDCAFAFLEPSGVDTDGPVESAYEHGEMTEAQLTLVGLQKDMSKADMELLNKIVANAHTQAFADSGLSIASFNALADIAVGGHEGWLHTCSLCCMYDDEDPRCPHFSNAATIVVAQVAASGTTNNNMMATKIAHADFEDFVCFKLRNSGSSTFQHVHDCSFNFVYTPVGKETKAVN